MKHLENTADGDAVVAKDVDAIILRVLVTILNMESEDFLPPYFYSSSMPGRFYIQDYWELYSKLA